MSIIPVEKTFPRGGLKEFATHPRPNFQSKSLFRTKKPRHIPRHNLQNDGSLNNTNDLNNKQQKDDNIFRIKKFTGQLTYKTVSEGMLTLGAIFAINELEMKVSLPGNTIATVPITNISETYTTALRTALMSHSSERISPLREMFKIGQHVVARVVAKVLQNNRNKITLSLDPQCIYSDINLGEVCKGSIVIAAVKSIEDKGYVMAVGKTAIRAFLSLDQSSAYELAWNGGKKLGLGQIVRCYVKKATTLDSTTTLVLTADPAKVVKASCDKTGATLETLMPGMKFTATVSHLFSTGIQIQLSDNFVGYVFRDHFEAPFKTSENYEVGMSVKAQVLYILPSGAVYFTLKPNILEATPPMDPYSILKCGEIISDAKVYSISDLGLIVKVGKQGNSGLKGFVPFKQTAYRPQEDFDEFDTPISQQLAMQFPLQSDVNCRIMDYNYMELYYVCTMDKDLMKEKIINPALLEVGMVLPCTIESIQLKGIVLNIGKGCRVTGFVPLTHISDVLLSNPEKKFHVGQTCMARVLSLKDGKFLFSMKRLQVQSKDPILSSFEHAKIGDVYTGSVQQINEHGLLIQFFNFVSGWLPTKYLGAGTSRSNITEKFDLGQLVPCKVVSKDETQQKLELSLRDFEMPLTKPEVNGTNAEMTGGKKKKEKKKKIKKSAEDNDTDKQLSAGLTPDVKIETPVLSKRAARKLIEEAKLEKKVANLSKRAARKLRFEANKKQKERKERKESLKSTDSTKRAAQKRKKSEDKEIEEEKEGEGEQNKQEPPKKKKKCSESSTPTVIKEEIPVVSKRAAKKLEAEAKRAARKLKAEAERAARKLKDLELKVEAERAAKKLEAEAERAAKKLEAEAEKAEQKGQESVEKRKNSDSAAESEKKKSKKAKERKEPGPKIVELKLPSLALSNGFVWDATPDLLPVVLEKHDEPESTDDEAEETTQPSKAKKTRQIILAEKRIQAQQEEARLRKIEQRLMDADAPPQSADEFDRLVLSSPDSSIVWLQYMAYHLQATEIERARKVGQRALQTISFREDQERLNVWGALLNVENLYGSKESLETTLEEAVRSNDAYQVHMQMLSIYSESFKFEEGDKLIQMMAKKYKYNKEMWFGAAKFYMQSSQLEKARALLNRALAILNKSEHVGVISRFALLENKLGSQERAQTLMEQVLTSYPKRVDVWSAYVDMLVKSNHIQLARQVLERGVAQKLQSHRMKTLFKKFLAFEEAHGTEEDALKVRQLALQYVESASSNSFS